MLTSTTDVNSTNASGNLKKLCRHFGHKLDVVFDDRQGQIRFLAGGIARLKAEADTLHMALTAEDEETLSRLQRVLADHLVRMAHKETLDIVWQRST